MSEFKIDSKTFKGFSVLIYNQFGIQLNDSKLQLVESRLQKLIKKNNLNGFAEYLSFLNQNIHRSELLSDLADCISTNHTFFWREAKHFEFFRDTLIPLFVKKNKTQKKIRVWCAASSTGEEPYQLAILLRNYFKSDYNLWDLGVLATDISDKALTIANQGIYSNEKILSLPKELLNGGFQKKGVDWEVKPEIKSDVTFRRFNLMNPLPFKSSFDIVFCRNVMIYFDEKTRVDLVNRIYEKMNPGGYLIISLSESLNRNKCPFQYLSPGIYQKK